MAWLLPVNVKSLNPALLREAGRGTTPVAGFGRDLLQRDKPGPAALVLEAARQVADPAAPELGTAFEAYAALHADLMPWGGWDVALEPLLAARPSGDGRSQPVLNFMVTQQARDNLRRYLSVSRLPGVQTLLRTAALTTTQRFVPAGRPGGQPLDAVILLTAYLWQTEHLAAGLQREVRAQAEAAVASGNLGELEDFYLDVLTLGKRLNWVQLSELLRTTGSLATVGQFAHLARLAPEHLPVIYTAALLTRSADGVAAYLIAFGQPGAEHLRLALTHGEGAVKQLVTRQAPVTAGAGPEFEWGAGFALRHPELALLAKYAAFLGGVFLLLRAVDLRLFRPVEQLLRAGFPRMGSGLIAAILTFLFFVFSEPFLLKAAPLSDYSLRLSIPVIGATAAPTPDPSTPATTMDLSTILSITLFAAIQVGMYVICLLKIAEVARQDVEPATKLKLMDNEENLFDGGLYIGIAGTATALVLQVLGLIDANLLAAYSSNLFGIVCVALVKIRHVRPYKRQLILAMQRSATT
ncbi:hypothetical protein [Lacunisphaera limnophila]|uniref:hypothetical protein n=1 Tax=Lacunisphaera limnophila TaxID=1838286 RepID=UPI0012FE1C24|nr:hypothetical protein [Lacunisphaera limnophila]